jgi:hypothetical protein
MATHDESTRPPDEDRFSAYLRWAHQEVQTWPEWKQNLLGWHLSKKKANKSGEHGRKDKGDQRPGNEGTGE